MRGGIRGILTAWMLVTIAAAGWFSAARASIVGLDPNYLNTSESFQLIESGPKRIRVRCHLEDGSMTAGNTQLRTLLAVPSAQFKIVADDYGYVLDTAKDPAGFVRKGDPSDIWRKGGFEALCFESETCNWYDLVLASVSIKKRLNDRKKTGSNSYLLKFVEFTLQFSGEIPTHSNYRQALQQKKPAGGFSEIFSSVVLNPQSVFEFRHRPQVSFEDRLYNAEAIGHDCSTGQAIRLYIEHEGLYEVSLQQLRQSGADIDHWGPDRLLLWSEGLTIPFEIEGLSPEGRWTEQSRIRFWGRGRSNDRMSSRIYYLTETKRPRRLIERLPRPISPVSSEAERAVAFQLDLAAEKIFVDEPNSFAKEEWCWFQLDKTNLTETISIPDLLADSSQDATAMLTIEGLCDLRQTASLEIILDDAHPLQTVSLERRNQFTSEIPVPYSLIGGGTHTLQFSIPEDISHSQAGGIWIKKISWQYNRRVDPGGAALLLDRSLWETTRDLWLPQPPSQLQVWGCNEDSARIWTLQERLEPDGAGSRLRIGGEVLPETCSHICVQSTPLWLQPEAIESFRSERLHEATEAVDVLIISHRDFLQAIQPLVQWRQQEGWKVRLLDSQAIYDEFSQGIYGPQPIRDFMSYVFANWPAPLPQYLLLVGDSSYDPRNNLEQPQGSFLPYASYNRRLAILDPADEWFVRINGTDALSDLIVGRISVASSTDCTQAVEKIIRVEKHPLLGPWRGRSLMMTDNHFEQRCRNILQQALPAEFSWEHLEIRDFPMSTNQRFKARGKPEKLATVAKRRLVAEANKGSAMMTYFGHGGGGVMAHEAWFIGLDRPSSDVFKLANRRRQPFVPILSCLTGLFNYPHGDYHYCLSEDLIRHSQRGAIGVMGPSGKGGAQDHEVMTRSLKKCLFDKQLIRLGDALTASKGLFYFLRNTTKIPEQFNYFGDPLSLNPVARKSGQIICSPTVINNLEGARVEIEGDRFDLGNARGMLQIVDANQRIYCTRQLNLIKGSFSTTWLCPPGLPGGEYRAVVYFWDAQSVQDAIAECPFTISTPRIEFHPDRIRRDRNSSKAVLSYRLKNLSADLPVTVEVGVRSDSGLLVREIVTLAADTEKAASIQFSSTQSALIKVEAKSVGSDAFASSRDSCAESTFLIVSEEQNDLFVAIDLSASIETEQDDTNLLSWPLRVFCDSTESLKRMQMSISASTEPLQLHEIDPGLRDWQPIAVSLPEETTQPVHLRIQTETVSGGTAAVQQSLSVPSHRQPDLALSHLERSDPHPVEGFTLYFLADIHNQGGAGDTRGHFQMRTDTKGSMANPLKNRQNILSPGIPASMEPGEIVRQVYRWDLFEGLGEFSVTASIEPEKGVKDSHLENNQREFSLTVQAVDDYFNQLSKLRRDSEGSNRKSLEMAFLTGLQQWETIASYELYDENFFKLKDIQRLALYALSTNRLDFAESLIKKSIELYPDESGSAYLEANLLLQKEQIEQGIQALTKAQEKGFFSLHENLSWDIEADPRFQRARDFSKSRWWWRAEDLYHLILEQQPANLMVLMELGQMYLRLEQHRKAVDVFQQMAKLSNYQYQRLPEYWFVQMARVYAEQNRPSEAEDILKKGQACYPDYDFSFWESLPKIGHGNDEEIKQVLLAMKPDRLEPEKKFYRWYQLGRCYELSRQPEEAQRVYRKALRIDPLHRDARRRLLKLRTSE